MSTPKQSPPAEVPSAKQAGDVRARWAWTEASVWTERMLTALENGVKGGIWFSLMDKVYAKRNLYAAFEKVRDNAGAAGVDHVSVEQFGERLVPNLEKLSESLRTGTYQPSAVRRVQIPKAGGKTRPLGIPTVRDRVVQTALRNVIEPIFEREFAKHSYGFRPERGCKDALRRVDALLKEGCHIVVDADLQSYFDTMDHDRLMALLREHIADGRVLALVESFLHQQVMDDMAPWIPEEGTPQGAVISPLLANIFLNALDHQMASLGFEMVRYADDFVILCRHREDAERALAVVRQWTAEAGLTLHPEKTHIADEREEGFDFLGYHFRSANRWPRKKSMTSLRDRLREPTKRTTGRRLLCTIAEINPLLRGWYGYFKHSLSNTFAEVDGWVRMRLRSILRKRQGLRGRGRGADHQRWKNAWFAEQGLFSLVEAHALECQSSSR